MSVFGIIFTAYNTADLLPLSLPPWLAARRGALGGDRLFKVAAVCCPFVGFDHGSAPVDNTLEVLQEHLARGEIDHLVTSPVPISETEARGRALKWLVGEGGVDFLWQWDADECAEEQDILSIARFVESQPYVSGFKVSYKNLVFSEGLYLAEPFAPMRIHRVDSRSSCLADHFWDDNNVAYRGAVTGRIVRDIEMSCLTIPTSVAWPLHHTWLNNDRSRVKVNYQRVRWGHSSFLWDESLGLLFDQGYYAARGEPLPEVLSLDRAPSTGLS